MLRAARRGDRREPRQRRPLRVDRLPPGSPRRVRARRGAPPRSTSSGSAVSWSARSSWASAPRRRTSVRVYGRLGGEAALLTTLSREGRPSVYPWAPAPGGLAQFLVAWEGPATGRGIRSLRLDLVRQHGDDLRVVWSIDRSVSRRADGARRTRCAATRSACATSRDYPGHAPGCEGQTEAEDVFRISPDSGTLVRRTRASSTDGIESFARRWPSSSTRWRRVTRRAWRSSCPTSTCARRLSVQLAARRRMRRRRLRRQPAVGVGGGDGRAPPWALTFQRGGARWRLVAAGPVLP